MSTPENAINHLKDVIGMVKDNVDKTLKYIGKPHVQKLAEALESLHITYELLLSKTRPSDSAVDFYVNYVLTRYISDIFITSALCLTEAVYALIRIALEQLEVSIVLDNSPKYSNLKLSQKLDVAASFMKERTFLRELLSELGNVLGSKGMSKLMAELTRFYGGLSSAVHGKIYYVRLSKLTPTMLIPLSCAETDEEAERVAGMVKRFNNVLTELYDAGLI